MYYNFSNQIKTKVFYEKKNKGLGCYFFWTDFGGGVAQFNGGDVRCQSSGCGFAANPYLGEFLFITSYANIEHDINAWGANPPTSSNRFTCVSATATGTPFVITGSGQWNSNPASFAIPLTVKPGTYYFAVVGMSQSDLDMAGTYNGNCHQVPVVIIMLPIKIAVLLFKEEW